MGAEKRRRFQPDPRTWLLLCLLGLAAILVIHSEIGCLCLFLRACSSTYWRAMAAKSLPMGCITSFFTVLAGWACG